MSQAQPLATASVVTLPTQPAVDAFMHADLAKSGLTAVEIGATIEVEPVTQTPVGYRIPYWLPNGQPHPVMYRTRLHTPGPSGNKYTQPGSQQFPEGVYPYLPPQRTLQHLRRGLKDPPLIVEGEKKALAAIKYLDRVAVGIGGCWNWAVKKDNGTHHVHSDLAREFTAGEVVEVVFDGDIHYNEEVQRAAGTLRRRLIQLGLKPYFVLLPAAQKGGGLDEWLFRLHTTGVNVANEFAALERVDGREFRESGVDVWVDFNLSVSDNGKPIPNESNITRILTKHDYFDSLRFNTTMKRMELGDMVNADVCTHVLVWMQDHINLPRVTLGVVKNALDALCREGSPLEHNPVKEMLLEASRKWDSVPRVDTFFIRAFGLPDTPYHRAVARAFFLGAARRGMQPGCKMDYVLILAGRGGIGKTTFFQHLAVTQEWVKEVTEALDRSKDARMALTRGWIVEASEGVALELSSAGGAKAIITDTVDEFRPPYGHAPVRYPRATVIVASTNDEAILKHEAGSGNRRFLPITMYGKVDLAMVDAEIMQVWGEAATRVTLGEREWEAAPAKGIPADLETLALEAQEGATERDPWVDVLEAYLEDPTHLHARNGGRAVSSRDLLHLGLGVPPDRVLASHGKRLRRAMASLPEWSHHTSTLRAGGANQKFTGYVRPLRPGE